MIASDGYERTNRRKANYLDLFSGKKEWHPLPDFPLDLDLPGFGLQMDGKITACDAGACFQLRLVMKLMHYVCFVSYS